MAGTTTFKAGNGHEVEVSADLWNAAVKLTEGHGDGRLSDADAKELFAIVAEDANYSDLEKKTIGHIRRYFKWTEKGDATFRKLISSQAGKQSWKARDVEGALED